MIVDDLHVVGITIVPDEADAVLIINSNAVLATSIACERLNPVTRKHRQVPKLAGGIELLELSLSNPCHILWPAAELASEEPMSLGIFKGPNHSTPKV